MVIFLIETICYDPSSEPPRRDCSDEGSEQTFLCRKQKLSLIITKYSLLSRALVYLYDNSYIFYVYWILYTFLT